MVDKTAELIADLHPAIQMHAYTMIVAARQAGVPLIIISGRRTTAQNEAAGGAASSMHLQGLAFDVAVLGYSRDQVPQAWWQALGEWAEQYLGLRWGGRFVHAGKPDVNHFDLRHLWT